LKIADIAITYRLQKAVFDASEGKHFSLTYGDSSLAKPNYDINNFSEYILQESIDLCALGEPTEIAAEEKSDFALGKLFMNSAIVLAAIILLIIIIAGFKKHGTA
jgi:hypothetical protein